MTPRRIRQPSFNWQTPSRRAAATLAIWLAGCAEAHVPAPLPVPVDVKLPEVAPPSASTTPVPLAPTDVVDLAVSSSSACAQRADGSVWCWGKRFGLTPQRLDAASGASSFGVGADGNACFVVGGALRCHGPRTSPAPVRGAPTSNVSWVEVGPNTSCLGETGGELLCWGTSAYHPQGRRDEPLPVPGVPSATSVALGSSFACALEPGGTVRCWGRGYEGEMGDGTTIGERAPGPVPGLTKVKELVAGDEFVCALSDMGSVQCWGAKPGSNHRPGGNEKVLTPSPVPGVTGATHAFAGKDTACATLAGDRLTCWGFDLSPRLDDGASLPAGVAKIGLGDGFACALGIDHRVRCWGDRAEGHLGDGRDLGQSTPVAVDVGPGSLAVGGRTCAVDAGRVRCVGRGETVQGTDVASVAFARDFTCAVRADRTVTCGGRSDDGRLGDQDEVEKPWVGDRIPHGHSPTRVPRVDDAIQVTLGDAFGCALDAHGRIQCWGSNDAKALGRGPGVTRTSPAPVVGIADAVEIRAASNGACARRRSGSVSCWGSARLLRNGDPRDRGTPFVMRGVTSATALAAGSGHACALLKDGSVSCWGDDDRGELGDGGTSAGRTRDDLRADPARVQGVSGVTAIAAGGRTTCALASGTVICWGSNEWGQAGGDVRAGAQQPQEVKGIKDATAIAMGPLHACARLASGEARCWGYVGDGQLGENAPRYAPEIVEVRLGP